MFMSELIDAARENETTTVNELLHNGVDVNFQDLDGNTPLILAASRGYKDVCRLLLLFGADKNLEHNEGWTALQAATNNRRNSVMKLLAVPIVPLLEKSKNDFMVAVLRASDLPKVDFIGSCDAFIKLTFGKQVHKTEIKKDSLLASWNQLFWFELSPAWLLTHPTLRLELFDHNKYFPVRLLGSASFAWQHLLLGGDFRVGVPIVAECGAGLINIHIMVLNARPVCVDSFKQGCQIDRFPHFASELQEYFQHILKITDLSVERRIPPSNACPNIQRFADVSRFCIVFIGTSSCTGQVYVKLEYEKECKNSSEDERLYANCFQNFVLSPQNMCLKIFLYLERGNNPDMLLGFVQIDNQHLRLGGNFNIPLICETPRQRSNSTGYCNIRFQLFTAHLTGFEPEGKIEYEQLQSLQNFCESSEKEYVRDLNQRISLPDLIPEEYFQLCEDGLMIAILSAKLPREGRIMPSSFIKIFSDIGEIGITSTVTESDHPQWNQLFDLSDHRNEHIYFALHSNSNRNIFENQFQEVVFPQENITDKHTTRYFPGTSRDYFVQVVAVKAKPTGNWFCQQGMQFDAEMFKYTLAAAFASKILEGKKFKALLIQKQIRRYNGKIAVKVKKQQEAAVKLQCFIRRYQAKKCLTKLMRKQKAVVSLQCLMRTYCAKNVLSKLKKEQKAVVSIQGLVRRFLAKTRVLLLKKLKINQFQAAVLLQRHFRRYQVVAKLKKQLEAAVKLQCFTRRYHAKKCLTTLMRKQKAVVSLQCLIRTYCAKMVLSKLKKEHKAVVSIQRLVRSFLAKIRVLWKKFEKLEKAATVMQHCVRRLLHHTAHCNMQDSLVSYHDAWLVPSENFVIVALISASGLPRMDTYPMTCDPFVKLFAKNQKAQSSIKYQTQSPVWNELFQFEIQTPPDSSDHPVRMEIYDYDWWKSEDHIGNTFLHWNNLDGNQLALPISPGPSNQQQAGQIQVIAAKCKVLFPGFKQGMKIPELFQENMEAVKAKKLASPAHS